jgi:hypothetical protein
VGCDKVQDTREGAWTLWVWDQPELRAIGIQRRWKYVTREKVEMDRGKLTVPWEMVRLDTSFYCM